MANLSDDALKDALEQRRKHIETNLECVLRFLPVQPIAGSDRSSLDKCLNAGFAANSP